MPVTSISPVDSLPVSPAVVWDAADPSQPLRSQVSRYQVEGRVGLRVGRIRDSLALDARGLHGSPSGTVAIWVAFVEGVHCAPRAPAFGKHLPTYDQHTILSDASPIEGIAAASFGVFFEASWHPGLIGKLCAGSIYRDAFVPVQKACALSNHFGFEAGRWYHLAMTWDAAARSVRLFANGVLVGAFDTTADAFVRDDPRGDQLYFGRPNQIVGRVELYETALSDAEIEAVYRSQATSRDDALDDHLRHTHRATKAPPFVFEPGPEWRTELALPLNRAGDLARFYVQGMTSATRITDEGLCVQTDPRPPGHTTDGEEKNKHVYLWTDRPFEGDLYVRYEFNPLADGGLGLLMFKASGMQGEDFMAEYPLRTDGSMKMVCWEDVRNYHWEFHRRMNDVRNDGESHALLKNPTMFPLAYRCFIEPQALGTWHRLELVMEGGRIRGAIDGRQVLEATDHSDVNSGPVYFGGRIAIRCMTRTKMLFRNLTVMTRPPSWLKPHEAPR